LVGSHFCSFILKLRFKADSLNRPQVKSSSTIREIFGTDLPKPSGEKKRRKRKRESSESSAALSSPVKKEEVTVKEARPAKKVKVREEASPEKPRKNQEAASVVKPRSKREAKGDSLSSESPAKKETKRAAVKIKEEPQEVKEEPKKERKKRKSQAPAVDPEAVAAAAAAAKLEESLKDAEQFYAGGAASGTLAAVAQAAEAAALRALEKEKPPSKRVPKKVKLKQEAAEADSDSDFQPANEEEQKLQTELQNFAMDLLEENPSWERRKIIQNLVIWEFVPVDPSLLPPQALPVNPLLLAPQAKPPVKRKSKKMRKHQSGLDFAKKKTVGKNSRCVSRATTPDVAVPEEVHDIVYSLDHLLAETGRWVIDKSAGETILHRAAKMGYPDAAAYALNMAKMSPVMKDNAGIPPIHKAAFRGHSDIVDYLLRYGADPNTNVKGTRPLHEALESGILESVHHLLGHGSGNLSWLHGYIYPAGI
jgi:hypothetical protein